MKFNSPKVNPNDKLRGGKWYALISRSEYGCLCGMSRDKEVVKKLMDAHFDRLVEVQVVRVFTKNPDVVEIENEL